MDPIFWIRAGAVLMFIVVAMGAFGAHALKDTLTVETKAIFETAVRYQAFHALGLFVVAWLGSRFPSKPVNMAGWCFLVGIILFSGSLFALSLTGIKKFGAITPIGGLLFLLGWLALLAASCRS